MRDWKVNEFDIVDRALKHNTAYSIHQSKECLRLLNMMRYITYGVIIATQWQVL